MDCLFKYINNRLQFIPKKWLKFYEHKIMSIVYPIRRIGGRFTSFLYRLYPMTFTLGGWKEELRLFFKSFGHFEFHFTINPHNLPNWTILYTLQYFNLSRNICGKHWLRGKNDQFGIYPLSEHGWRAIQQKRAPFEPIITCISVNEESLGYDTISYQHFLRIKYHFYENYFKRICI